MFQRPTKGASLSFLLSLTLPLSRGYTVIAPRRNEKHKTFVVTGHAGNPIRAGYPPNATPRFYSKPFSPHPPPSQTQTCRLSSLEGFYGLCSLRVARANVSPIVPVMYYWLQIHFLVA